MPRLRVAQFVSRLLLLVCTLLPVSCAFSAGADRRDGDELDARVDALLAEMTLDQRVGQMFMISVPGESVPPSTAEFLRQMAPGAIAMFRPNGSTPFTATRVINAWQSAAPVTEAGTPIPLIIAIDHEGGTVVRFTEGFSSLPWGAAVGAMPPDDARQVGAIAAAELRAVGINMNLAPVVDVRVPVLPGETPFMEARTFGPDPTRVGAAGAAYLEGLQNNGVIATLKHFPGHGSAPDSHRQLPMVRADRAMLDAIELPPFAAGIAAGADAVMVGHLVVPALDPTPGMPASLSRAVVTDLLREEMAFEGVIMTDAMDMRAITDHFGLPHASVMAVTAGIDLIATGPGLTFDMMLAMKQAVLDAVANGEIDEARITESARRVLMLKARRDLLDWAPLQPENAPQRVDSAGHSAAIASIYLNTVTVVYDFLGFLPLNPEQVRVGILYPGAFPAVARECSTIDAQARTFAYSLSPTGGEIGSAARLAGQVDVVVIFTYNMRQYPRQATLVNAVPQVQTIVVALENPYDFEQGIDPIAYLAAFNPYTPAFHAACAVLYGQHPAIGVFEIETG